MADFRQPIKRIIVVLRIYPAAQLLIIPAADNNPIAGEVII